MQVDPLVHGNGLAFVNKVRGVPREIIRIDPRCCTIVNDNGVRRYTVNDGLGQRAIAREDMIHVRALSLDGVAGRSPVAMAGQLRKG